jgi:hypothetical protein
MAKTKTVLPKIAKKWYTLKIDPKTLRPIRFSWRLASGFKEVLVYNADNKPEEDIMNVNIRNYITSYYFVLDKVNKRIFAYPIYLAGNTTRKECETACYKPASDNEFYMFDENKQIWAIPRFEYQKYVRFDWQTHQSVYETIEAKPRKVSRLSTYYYKQQCQLTSHVRSMFAELYGNEFVYHHRTELSAEGLAVSGGNIISFSGRSLCILTGKRKHWMCIYPEHSTMPEFKINCIKFDNSLGFLWLGTDKGYA